MEELKKWEIVPKGYNPIYKVSTNQISINEVVKIRGKVVFSRLGSLIEGAELERRNKENSIRGIQPIDSPYFTLTIKDAYVEFTDPDNPTAGELYAYQRIYTQKSTNARFFQLIAKCKNPDDIGKVKFVQPMLGVPKDGDTKNYIKTRLQKGQELSKDLDVTIIMSVYKAKPNNGISYRYVLLNEPLKLYESQSTIDRSLEASGIVFVADETGDNDVVENNVDNSMNAQSNTEDDVLIELDDLNLDDLDSNIDVFTTSSLNM